VHRRECDQFVAKANGQKKYHYVGKDYVHLGKHYATEVTSMGIERLNDDPIEFAKNDTDFFDHVIRILRGQYQP
jgi:hypothetical protein